MRVKYPIDNLENRKKAMNLNAYYPRLANLQELGYMLKYGDFSQKRMNEILEEKYIEDSFFYSEDFCHHLASDVRDINNYEKYKDCILIALDFSISYLSTEYIYQIIFDDEKFYIGTEPWECKTVVKDIVVSYIEENKEEFPEIYLELKLG